MKVFPLKRLMAALFLPPLLLISCVKKKDQDTSRIDYPYHITATTGMIADLVQEIAGEQAKVTTLIGEGIDPHSFRPGKSDIDALEVAHAIFYNGHLLEGKMGEILAKQRTEGKFVVPVTEELPGYEIIGGTSHADPHLWMDVTAWTKVASRIAERLAKFDPANGNLYKSRAAQLVNRLQVLDGYARHSIGTIPTNQRYLVTAHDAFSYLGRAYGIEVQGIQGISTESEAGVQEIETLVSFLVEKKIPAVFVESSVSDKSVRALIEGASAQGHNVKIGGELYSDAMGSPGTYEGTYEGMIDHNITVITRALGGEAPAGGLKGKLTPGE